MIVVTGAYGFIGSCLIAALNKLGITDIIAVDDFTQDRKAANLVGKLIAQRVERADFIPYFERHHEDIRFVIHLGARTDTTEFDYSILEALNPEYSKNIWHICTKHHIPLVYASSAATYGNGELGYSDQSPTLPYSLQPLNPYGVSKNVFDQWVLQQTKAPPFWAGMKFFNVYGPNEYHKARMASVIFHFFHQISEKGSANLFKSHHPDYLDGEQKRDFIYVKDVVNVLIHLFQNPTGIPSGIYNLGTGKARSFNDLVKAIFKTLGKPENIRYVDIPIDIRDKYQYFTEADMAKLTTAAKYDSPFTSLEAGIEDYVQNYLFGEKRYM